MLHAGTRPDHVRPVEEDGSHLWLPVIRPVEGAEVEITYKGKVSPTIAIAIAELKNAWKGDPVLLEKKKTGRGDGFAITSSEHQVRILSSTETGLLYGVYSLLRMQAAGQPWAVSGLAQAAGLAALQESAYAEEVRALIEAERPRLAAGLRALGLYVIEGRANYLLFRAPADFGEKLRQHGAVVRSCGNYPGLDDGWYRTAVRTAEENTKLLAIMKEVLA